MLFSWSVSIYAEIDPFKTMFIFLVSPITIEELGLLGSVNLSVSGTSIAVSICVGIDA